MAQEDPLDGLEERLQKHSQAFESLLALTPARDHYGSQVEDGLDPSEQWNRKKQTKEEKRAAKKAKLDPANQKSALDVMKEREKESERKRKRGPGDEEEAEDEATPGDDVVPTKRQKQLPLTPEEVEAKKKAVAEKRKEKRMQKKEKNAATKAKQEAKKAKKQQLQSVSEVAEVGAEDEEEEGDDDEAEDAEHIDEADMEKLDFSGLAGSDNEDNAAEESSVPTSPVVNSPAFDVATNHSEASSSSSIMPPSKADQSEVPIPKAAPTQTLKDSQTQRPPKQISLPKFDPTINDLPSGTSSPKIILPDVDPALLQERLRKRIEELRAKRKADGPDGKPARSRQELLEQRRQKGEQRKAHKKELRRAAKEEESRQQEERLRGSGSPAADIFERRESPRPKQDDNSFSFSRLAFEDGSAADASLSTLNDPRKKKGPQDVKTALLAAQKKQSRLSGLDEEKRSSIAEKDMWLNAKRKAHGEKVRDDTSLLKKALKRQEKSKSKSEMEWKEREDNVVKGKEMKQKKREGNLAKRREEKGGKGKKSGGAKKGGSSGKGKKKGGRAGFEGRFKA